MAEDEVPLCLAGAEVVALADRALFWPAEEALFVADVHFGKDATFRHAGRWVPPGTTRDDLGRLSGLIRRYQARRLIILGDAFHSEHASEEPTFAKLRDWRTRLVGDVLMVKGNHDRRATEIADRLDFTIAEEGLAMPPFVLRHHPIPQAEGYVLCGHLHPVVSARGAARQRMRVPCFWAGTRQCVLPAFGGFTGGSLVRPARGDRIILVAGGKIRDATPGGAPDCGSLDRD